MPFHRAPRLSTWRKMALVTWDAPHGPTAYGKMELECDRALAYIDALRARTSERVTLTHFVGKAAAMAIASAPEVNGFASMGRLMLRDSVDVFFQVAFFDEKTAHEEAGTRRDANLAGAKVRHTDAKSVVEIARELRERAIALRERGDAPTANVARAMSRLPGPVVSIATRFASFLSHDLGIDMRPLGLPDDPFGSCMVTNVGVFGIREGYAPLIPYARVPIILTLGAVRDAAVVRDGSVVTRKVVTIGVAFDHRVMDGYHAGVMSKQFAAAFADPESAFG